MRPGFVERHDLVPRLDARLSGRGWRLSGTALVGGVRDDDALLNLGNRQLRAIHAVRDETPSKITKASKMFIAGPLAIMINFCQNGFS